MYRDLIIGYDGTATGRDALALGRRLALATGAHPMVVHVRPSALVPVDVPMDPEDLSWGAAVATILDDARAFMADVPDVTFSGVAETSAARVLHGFAQDADAPLIVLGTSHRTGLGRIVPGTTADAVLRAAPCAVAIAPAGYEASSARRPFGMVVAAVDGGAETERVARVGAAIARQARSAMRLVTVSERRYTDGPLYAGNNGYASLRAALRELGDEILARATEAAGAGVEIERRAVEGDAGDLLARHSADADLLVIGSRGFGPLRRAVFGSATRAILEAATVPVLAVPRGTAEEDDEGLATLGAAIAGADAGVLHEAGRDD